MQVKTTGIILHQIRYTDSSNIVSIYTRKFGRMSYFVRGASKKKSACRPALLQPLSVVEIEAVHSPKRTIHTLREMRVALPFYEIPFDQVKIALALFIAEILHKTLKHSENDEELYNFIENSIRELDACKDGLGNFHLVFMTQLSHYLGFAPNMDNPDQAEYFDLMNGIFIHQPPSHIHYLKPETTDALKKLTTLDYQNLNTMKLSRSERSELLDKLIEYYQLHLPDFFPVASLDILHKLWE